MFYLLRFLKKITVWPFMPSNKLKVAPKSKKVGNHWFNQSVHPILPKSLVYVCVWLPVWGRLLYAWMRAHWCVTICALVCACMCACMCAWKCAYGWCMCACICACMWAYGSRVCACMCAHGSNQIKSIFVYLMEKKYHDCHRRKGGLQNTTRWTVLQQLTWEI